MVLHQKHCNCFGHQQIDAVAQSLLEKFDMFANIGQLLVDSGMETVNVFCKQTTGDCDNLLVTIFGIGVMRYDIISLSIEIDRYSIKTPPDSRCIMLA